MTELIRELLNGLQEMRNNQNEGEDKTMNTTTATATNNNMMSAADFLSELKELQSEQKKKAAAAAEAAAQAREERLEKSRLFIVNKGLEVIGGFLRMQNEGLDVNNTRAKESIEAYVATLTDDVLAEGVYVKMAIGMAQPVNYGLYDFSVDPDGKEGGRRLNFKIRLVPVMKRLDVFLRSIAMVEAKEDALKPLVPQVLERLDGDWRMPVCRKEMSSAKRYLGAHPDTVVFTLNARNYVYFSDEAMVIMTIGDDRKIAGKWTFDVHNARQG